MNPAINMTHPSRSPVPSPLTGKLVRIHGNKTYEDIFGIHLGSFRNSNWDPTGDYIFHTILSCAGMVCNYCFRTREDVSQIIEVIA